MRTKLHIILSAILLSAVLPCRGAAALKDAQEIKKGVLANGISYYLASNPACKGTADFALVQKDFTDPAASRAALAHLPLFGRRSPAAFAAAHGAGYGPDGYVSYNSGSTVFHFRGMDVKDRAVSDSTLLMMLSLAGTCPGSQAIIISGDMDAGTLDRLSLLSLTVSRRERESAHDGYNWDPRPDPQFFFSGNASDNVASVRISYAMQRLPKDKMQTLQPFVSRQYASYLGSILGKRIQSDFRHRAIPLGDIRYHYHSSADGPGDEVCAVSVTTSSASYSAAVERIAAILSDMDSKGVSASELQDAKDKLVSESMLKAGNSRLSNEEYVHKCTAAFLYGASLASDASVAQMFASSRLSGDKELQLFNNYIAAMLDPEANLSIGFDTPDASEDPQLAAIFAAGWRNAGAASEPETMYVADYGDTLTLYAPKTRIKIKSESKEPMTGGSIWTFTNGMKVIYKKTQAKGAFTYAMLLRGGSTSVAGLADGENAFVQDMLAISDIAGLKGEAFRSMLRANGISMEHHVSLGDLTIRGECPSSKFGLLMQSLLSMANSRNINASSFESYKADEQLRIQLRMMSEKGIDAELDRLLAPDDRYTANKNMEALGDDLPQRAEEYFREQFSKCADGVMVIMGDLDAAEARRQLCASLGDFVTEKKFAVLAPVKINHMTGTTTYTESASDSHFSSAARGVNLALTAPMNFSMDNYLAYRLAMVALEGRLARALSPEGARASINSRMDLYPEVRVTMHVSCRPCPEQGLPEGVSPAEPLSLLETVRSVLFQMSSKGLDKKEFESCRKSLENILTAELGDDSGMMDAVLARYSYGKDIVSGWQKQLKALSPESVASITNALQSGGRIEYVIL